MDQARLERARQFLSALPFCQALGMELLEAGDGFAEIAMPWDARLVGDPATGVIHGGAVSALMDSVAFVRAVAHDGDASRPVATGAAAFTVEAVA